MDTAQKIRQAVAEVSLLREEGMATPAIGDAVRRIKGLQGLRFAGTYADLLAAGHYAAAARFFLEELYSDKDYAERDAQFARIAGAVERLFPADVADTAVALAQLHALTEGLDHAMALAWLATTDASSESERYVAAWRAIGRRADRERQLSVVMAIGMEMARLTRAPGLRFMLKMMRGPAAAAGLGSLQRFLETGFDTFAAMARRPGGAENFLDIIRGREAAFIAQMFDGDPVASGTDLARILGQAR
jgi:hypothetical protein